MREVGYVELTPQIYDLAKAHFAEKKLGTAFGKGGLAGRNDAGGSARAGKMKRFEPVIERGLFLCALLSVGTTIGIIAVLAVETAAFLREVPIHGFPVRHRVDAALLHAELRRAAARVGDGPRVADRDAGRAADGTAERDLPQRVRQLAA